MDPHATSKAPRFVRMAVCSELAFGGLAILLGWLTGPWPWESLTTADGNAFFSATVFGGAVAVVSFAGVMLLDRYPTAFFRDLQNLIRYQIVPMFRGIHLGGLLLISIAAGVGEELLFRGYAQSALARHLPFPGSTGIALVVASLLFGVCHWISPSYALLATGMGFVLGGLYEATGNLVAPIVAHALYDFLALWYLTRTFEPEIAEQELGE